MPQQQCCKKERRFQLKILPVSFLLSRTQASFYMFAIWIFNMFFFHIFFCRLRRFLFSNIVCYWIILTPCYFMTGRYADWVGYGNGFEEFGAIFLWFWWFFLKFLMNCCRVCCIFQFGVFNGVVQGVQGDPYPLSTRNLLKFIKIVLNIDLFKKFDIPLLSNPQKH